MAKKFDISKFKESAGRLYKNEGTALNPAWFRASRSETEKYYKYINGSGNKSAKAPSKLMKVEPRFKKYFGPSTRLTGANGRIASWARPLSLKGGSNPVYGWDRVRYVGENGRLGKDSSGRLWGANLNKLNKKDIGKSGIGAGAVLNGSREWIRQIRISMHQLTINAEYFRIAVGNRAIKVFQDSIKYQQFWSSNGKRWAALSSYTLKKRAKRHTGNHILKEYGDLYNSIKLNPTASKGLTRIYTDVVNANVSHHKTHSICYAGYHNDPRPGDTYGNGFGTKRPKKYIRRQFIGFSDKIDSFAFSIMKRYLFDSVFLIRKV